MHLGVIVYLLTFSVQFLKYCLLACQPVDLRTGSALGGRVSTVSPGPHENPDQLIVLAPAHPGLLLLLILTSDAFQQSC